MHLLIFKINQLGDNVVYLPVVQELRKKLIDWKITVFTSPVAEPLYRIACPGVDVSTFITRDLNGSWRKPWQIPELIRKTQAIKADVCLFGDDQGNVAHLMGRLSSARVTVGPLWKHIPFTNLLRVPVHLDSSDAVPVQNWKLAAAFLDLMNLSPFESLVPTAPDLSAFGRDEHRAVIIHPGASSPSKRWPLDRFITLANQLSDSHPVHWIMQKWEKEKQLSSQVKLIQMSTLESFIRHMADSRLFIGNNSGPMNIAASLGVPSIIINGRSPVIWDPIWNTDRISLLKDAEGKTGDNIMAGEDWDIETVYQLAVEKISAG